MKNYNNILVVKNRAIGDSILGLSACKYLKELYPDCCLTYAVPKKIESLYDNITSYYDFLYGLELNSIKDLFNLFSFLKKEKIDLIFELFQSGRTGYFFNLYSRFLSFDYLFHNHHNTSETGVLDQGIVKSIIQRDLDGVFSLVSNKQKYPIALNYIPEINLNINVQKKNIIILGLVATRQAKMWPIENYIALARELNKKFNSTIYIPISGSVEDLEIKRIVLKYNINFIKIIEESLKNLPALLAKARLYIGNDTGLKHICVSLGIKTYTFFGPEQPREWHPYDKKKHPYFFIDDTKMPCRTKKGDYCGIQDCSNHLCLNLITPQDVISFIKF